MNRADARAHVRDSAVAIGKLSLGVREYAINGTTASSSARSRVRTDSEACFIFCSDPIFGHGVSFPTTVSEGAAVELPPNQAVALCPICASFWSLKVYGFVVEVNNTSTTLQSRFNGNSLTI